MFVSQSVLCLYSNFLHNLARQKRFFPLINSISLSVTDLDGSNKQEKIQLEGGMNKKSSVQVVDILKEPEYYIYTKKDS